MRLHLEWRVAATVRRAIRAAAVRTQPRVTVGRENSSIWTARMTWPWLEPLNPALVTVTRYSVIRRLVDVKTARTIPMETSVNSARMDSMETQRQERLMTAKPVLVLESAPRSLLLVEQMFHRRKASTAIAVIRATKEDIASVAVVATLVIQRRREESVASVAATQTEV